MSKITIDLLGAYNQMYALNIPEKYLDINEASGKTFEEFKRYIKVNEDSLLVTADNYYSIAKKTAEKIIGDSTKNIELIDFLLKTLEIDENYYQPTHVDVSLIWVKKNVLDNMPKDELYHISSCIKLLSEKISYKDKYNMEYGKIYENLSELKKDTKVLFKNTVFSDSNLRSLYTVIDDLLKFYNWLFDINLNYYDGNFSSETSYKNIGKILDVVTVGNERFFSIKLNFQKYDWIRQLESKCIIGNADINSPFYNFIDKNRYIMYHEHIDDIKYINVGYFMSSEQPHVVVGVGYPKIVFTDFVIDTNITLEIQSSIVEKYKLSSNKNLLLIDNLSLKSITRKLIREEKLKIEEKNNKSLIKQKYTDKLQKIKVDPSAKLNFNGVELTQTSIAYNGEKIEYLGGKLTKKDFASKFFYSLQNYTSLEDVNFDYARQLFFDSAIAPLIYLSSPEDIGIYHSTLKIGDVTSKVSVEVKVNSASNIHRIFKINDMRIKADEISEILEKAICHNTTETFNKFVDKVSKCSLLVHGYLNTGVLINVHDGFLGMRIKTKIPLIRKNGKNYIKINGKEYKISNTNKIINLYKADNITTVINTLLNPEVVEINSSSDVGSLISAGVELYEKDRTKNRKMIEKVEKMFGIELQNFNLKGKSLRGYRIKGKIGDYFLDIGQTDKETFFDNLRVFTVPDMRYICMIDKGVDQTGPTQLINRIFALNNDSLVSGHITTLTK
jgi:hypothetical protein